MRILSQRHNTSTDHSPGFRPRKPGSNTLVALRHKIIIFTCARLNICGTVERIKHLRIPALAKMLFLIPASTFAVFVPYSMLVGWNLITLFVFWFVIMPWTMMLFANLWSRGKNVEVNALVGMMVFYAFFSFMTYKVIDYGEWNPVTLSFCYNLVIMAAVIWSNQADKKAVKI